MVPSSTIGPPVAQFAEFGKVPKGFSKLCCSMENTLIIIIHVSTRLCVRGSHMRKKFVLGVFEQYLFAYGDSHMGICSQFVHEKFAYGDPHMQKCLKMHISDRLFLHNEVVRIWGLTGRAFEFLCRFLCVYFPYFVSGSTIGPPVAQFAEFSKVPKGFSKLCGSMENT